MGCGRSRWGGVGVKIGWGRGLAAAEVTQKREEKDKEDNAEVTSKRKRRKKKN